MKALIQRVSHAKVEVDSQPISQIDAGLLVLLGVEQGDNQEKLQKLAHKVCHYRMFADDNGKTNLNVQQVGGQLLVVSQFTLVAQTDKGLRPGFSKGASPELAQELYFDFVNACRGIGLQVGEGQFAANMQVSLCNDGPMTFMIEV